MATELQDTIAVPPRADWLAYTPINASDAASVIEPIQQAYARAGAKCWQFAGEWENDDVNGWYTENFTSGPDLDEIDAVSLPRRPDGDGDYQVDLSIWGYDVDVRLTAYRIDSDGTETQIGQGTASMTGSTLEHASVTLTLAAADTREGGVSGGDQAPIKYTVEGQFRDNVATEGHLEDGTIYEAELPAADVP